MKTIMNVVIGLVTLAIICIALFFGAAWLFSLLKNITPKTLSLASLGLIVVPLIVMAVYFQVAKEDSGAAAYGVIAMLIAQLGIVGLMASGVWYLIRRFF